MADLAQVLRLGGAAYLHDHTLNTSRRAGSMWLVSLPS